MNSLDLTIITVTYQSRQFIDPCILSVIASSWKCSYEHIIVDNGSTDGTCDWIQTWHAGSVRLIQNKDNEGFAAANNRALKEAQGRYILFLNPDMEIREGSLDELIEWMDHRPEVGLASCKLVNNEGRAAVSLRPHRFPSLWPYVVSFLSSRPFFCTIHPRFFYKDFDPDKEQKVEVVRGAFMLTRREILDRLGFAFDPRYFLLFEDVDLCREIQRMGLEVVYTPLLSCADYFGRSFTHHTSSWKYFQMSQSFQTYLCKWHSPLHLLWAKLLIWVGARLRNFSVRL
jgi:GT2 family glycosyltransferase